MIIVYNILQKNYRFLYKSDQYKILVSNGQILAVRTEHHKAEKSTLQVNENLYHNSIVNQKEFEEYFKIHKPYLNPEFKITDLTEVLNTNRAYLSKFINETYGVNFKQYLNTWRMKEVESLLQMEEEKNTTEELVKQAGFGSIRSYWRAKKNQE